MHAYKTRSVTSKEKKDMEEKHMEYMQEKDIQDQKGLELLNSIDSSWIRLLGYSVSGGGRDKKDKLYRCQTDYSGIVRETFLGYIEDTKSQTLGPLYIKLFITTEGKKYYHV